ncbi:pilus assembly PilX family protein [Chitinimonas naiadis]
MTLLIALIALVALTLTGLSLVRSISSTNEIAGNIAFRQSTIHSSDRALDAAEALISTGGLLQSKALTGSPAVLQYVSWNAVDQYYTATRYPTEFTTAHPAACGTDMNCLKTSGIPNRLLPAQTATAGNPTGLCKSAADATAITAQSGLARYDATSGNCTITTIERLCTQNGITSKAWCVQFSNTPNDPAAANYDQSHGGDDNIGGLAPAPVTAVALRVTVRTDGARGTTSYVQAIMTLPIGN